MTHPRAAAALGLPTPHHDALGCSRALAAVVAAASRPAPEQPDAELLALAATVDRLQGQIAPMLGNPDPQLDAAYEALSQPQTEAMRAMANLRATTLAGFAVQARAVRYIFGEEFTEDGFELDGGTASQLAWAVLSGLAWASPAHGSAEGARPATVADHHDAELIDLGRRWAVLMQDWRQFDTDELHLTRE